jgi:hypothetical protein
VTTGRGPPVFHRQRPAPILESQRVRIFVELSARFFVARPSAFAVGCFGGMEARYEVAEDL